MTLLDLLTVEEWNEFSKQMHQKYGISFGISDTAGARVSTYANWCNQLCPEIKSNPQSLAAVCAVAAQHFTDRTRQSREPEIDFCDIGLLKIAVPIFVGDTFLGTAGGCGFLSESGEVDAFMIGKVMGWDAPKVADFTTDLVPMSQARANEMVADVSSRIAAIVKNHQP